MSATGNTEAINSILAFSEDERYIMGGAQVGDATTAPAASGHQEKVGEETGPAASNPTESADVV